MCQLWHLCCHPDIKRPAKIWKRIFTTKIPPRHYCYLWFINTKWAVIVHISRRKPVGNEEFSLPTGLSVFNGNASWGVLYTALIGFGRFCRSLLRVLSIYVHRRGAFGVARFDNKAERQSWFMYSIYVIRSLYYRCRKHLASSCPLYSSVCNSQQQFRS